MHLLPRIARSDPAAGFVTEAMAAAIAQGDDEAKARLRAFLEKRAPKVTRS
jgi:(methylthio)acryloyl-CoA hydratase